MTPLRVRPVMHVYLMWPRFYIFYSRNNVINFDLLHWCLLGGKSKKKIIACKCDVHAQCPCDEFICSGKL